MADRFDILKNMNKNNDSNEKIESIKEQLLEVENSNNTNKIRSKNPLKQFMIFLLVIFVAANVSLYTTIIVRQTAFGPYKTGKFILSNSMFLTTCYIYPIGKAFGPDFPILKPLRFVRDKLYYYGIQFIPEDDAEREMWWYSTRYNDLIELHNSTIQDYVNERKTADETNLPYLILLTDEMYLHLYKIANIHKLDDKNFQKLRLKIFTNQVAFRYTNQRYFLLLKHNPELLKSEISRFQNILNWYLSLKKYCKVYETDGYEFLFNEEAYLGSEPRLVYFLSGMILNSSLSEGRNICNTELLKLYLNSRQELIEIINLNYKHENSIYINQLLNDRFLFKKNLSDVFIYSEKSCNKNH